MRPGVRWDGARIEKGREKLSAGQRQRWLPPNIGKGRPPRLLLDEVVAGLRASNGNLSGAALGLKVARQSVLAFLDRHRDEIPLDVRDLLEARRRPRRAGIAA